jgi:hypothetical protein
MSQVPKSFTALGAGDALFVKKGQSAQYFLSGTFSATLKLQKSTNGPSGPWVDVTSKTAAASGSFDAVKDTHLRWFCSAFVSGTAVTKLQDVGNSVASTSKIAQFLGEVNAVAGLTAVANINELTGDFKIDFSLENVALTMTDAGASGASASLKLWDFVQGVVASKGSRQNLTFASDTTLDVAGDLTLVHALGSVAANAGDGVLTGTEADFAAVSGTVTFAANAGASASLPKAGLVGVDGTGTANDLYLNFSAFAATADATGILTVSGSITFAGVMLGDD